jgi:hypothetical protein
MDLKIKSEERMNEVPYISRSLLVLVLAGKTGCIFTCIMCATISMDEQKYTMRKKFITFPGLLFRQKCHVKVFASFFLL